MKILLMDQYFYPDLQMTSVLLTDLALYLKQHHDVTVICGTSSLVDNTAAADADRYKFYNGVKINRVQSTVFNRKHILGRLSNYLTFLTLAFINGLSISKPDVIISMSTPPLSGLVAYLISKIKKIPYIYICQDLFPYTAIKTGLLKNRLLVKLLLQLNRFPLKKCHKIVAISGIMKRKITEEGIPAEKIEVIQNWAETNSAKLADKNRYGLNGKFLVLYAGNIGLMQNMDIILESAKKLQPYTKIQFLIIGAGVETERIRQRIRKEDIKNVLMFPFQVNGNIYACSDVCLVTQKQGLAGYTEPTKTYYIMSAGKPIIASIDPESETAKITSTANCGFVVSPGDADKLSDKIKYLYENQDGAESLGENAKKFTEETKYRETAFDKYSRLIEEIKE